MKKLLIFTKIDSLGLVVYYMLTIGRDTVGRNDYPGIE